MSERKQFWYTQLVLFVIALCFTIFIVNYEYKGEEQCYAHLGHTQESYLESMSRLGGTNNSVVYKNAEMYPREADVERCGY